VDSVSEGIRFSLRPSRTGGLLSWDPRRLVLKSSHPSSPPLSSFSFSFSFYFFLFCLLFVPPIFFSYLRWKDRRVMQPGVDKKKRWAVSTFY
jgi:hypothetical protein